MEYLFRKAVPQDLEEVVCLFNMAITIMINNQIFQWDEIYPNEEVLSEDINKGEMNLLTKGKKIVACVVINEEQDVSYSSASWRFLDGKIAVLHRLCVHPDAQGEGNGKRVIKYAEEQIQKLGYSTIRLDAFSNNYIARRLYEHLGYSYAGEVTFRKGLFCLLEKSFLFVDKLSVNSLAK